MTGRGNVSRFQLKGQSRAGIGGPRYLPGSAPHRLTHLGLACPARHAGAGGGGPGEVAAEDGGVEQRHPAQRRLP